MSGSTPKVPETKEQVLAALTSRDPHRIWSASWAIVKTRDPDVLGYLAPLADAVVAATNGVDLGGMFVPNRRALDTALARLAFFAAKKGCLCALYADNIQIDPAREQEAGHVAIVERVPAARRVVCACAQCGRRWDVKEEEGHHTYWEWTSPPR